MGEQVYEKTATDVLRGRGSWSAAGARFTVQGFAATPAGRDEVFAFAFDADLPGEIRRRFAESGLA